MRGRTIVGLSAIAVAIIAIPLITSTGPRQQDQGMNIQSASQERTMKLNVMQQDMDITKRMLATNTQQDMEAAALAWKQGNGKQLAELIKQFVDENPHFSYIQLIDYANHHQVTSGDVPAAANDNMQRKLNSYVMTAKQQLQQKLRYRSPEIKIKGKPHLVLSWPDERINGGVIAIVNQNIVHDVEQHQQRNLRLVPYPREGKYRVESVDTNTMQDVTVKDGEDNQGTSHYYKFEVVVRFRKPPTESEMARIKRDISCQHVRKSGYTYIFRSKTLDSKRLTDYFSQYNPYYIEPHYLYMTNDMKRADGTPTSMNASALDPYRSTRSPMMRRNDTLSSNEPNDAMYKPYQWDLPLIKTNLGWNITKGSSDVIIAVVDTGVDTNHSDLKNKLVSGYNAINPELPPNDDVGHGTHVAGVIGASTNNQEGIAGMTWNNPIMPVKVLDNSGAGSSYSVAEGIIWAADHGAKVINLSLGNYAQGAFLHDAIRYAYDKDVVIVAATGNDNTNQPGYPAAYPEVFSVSATDQNEAKASYSNYGDYVDVVAPGTSIASTYPNNQYAALSGTSMACPHVTALAGLIRSANPALSNVQVYDIMRQSVKDLGPSGKDNYFGYGQIDVNAALTLAVQNQSARSLHSKPFEKKAQLQLGKHNAR